MRLAITLALASLCAFSGNSHADALDLPSSSGPQTAPAAGDSLTVGGGIAYVPEYAGSKKSRVVPLPYIERTFDNGFFLSTMRGAGFQTSVSGVGLSAALSYGGARADHKRNIFDGSDALKGMGDIQGAAQAVLGASYQFGTVGVSLSTTQNLAHREHGATYTLGAATQLYTTASDQVGLSVSTEYADKKHMQTYFGVTAAQSAASGYKAYNARGGIANVTTSVSWNHVLDKNWSVHTVLGITQLASDAADSPLTKRKTTPMLMTGVAYKF
ncbi:MULTISPECIES: MipA/OmpV family protein [unclassified Duganella]|uniref:MipA/OmpV family protein n=1 Tax=unclassified Duganella TaxID=2636909 RepID=UPI000E342228|nr:MULTISPECIES: MipA/OmpV family protein [unclassified Duganella]RFP16114.1 MipA/OmpV family protein [Duganella sp. BJB475]RFP32723.1 MipA/OmpV family protein [Duganella sp. BJB476]